MAAGEHKLSRRAVLGAAFAAPALSAIEGPVLSGVEAPVPGSRQSTTLTGWTRGLAAFRRAEAALAVAADTAGEDFYDRLGTRCDRALERLLRAPAPDVAAVAVKLDLVLYEEAGEFLGDTRAMKALKQDAHRLAASPG